MADDKQLHLILGNAKRLLDDSRLLVDHRRYASAFALAVLGVEEIGKILLKGWEAEKPLAEPKKQITAHIRKQTAVASLLLGAKVVRMFPNGVDWGWSTSMP
jgi:AbiV family abortive infection protein